MIGPAFGATLFKDYYQAILAALGFTVLSGIFLAALPQPKVLLF